MKMVVESLTDARLGNVQVPHQNCVTQLCGKSFWILGNHFLKTVLLHQFPLLEHKIKTKLTHHSRARENNLKVCSFFRLVGWKSKH